ncbi:MAG: ATP-binding protein [Ignavibacteriales bacterium]|nr:MAG: ATP-binding protein [Ignavibacteriales bacterium]
MNNHNSIEKELKVKSTTDNLERIREFIKAVSAQSGFSDDVIDKISLAVDEACTNIIKHAYKNSPNGDIVINAKLFDNKLTVSITDFGLDFNPDTVPVPDIKKYYQQHKVGGLGIYLMKKLMDEVKYNPSVDNKNQVVLVKYLSR